MKPPEKKWPQVNVAGRQPERPAAHARTFKPPVAQSKSAAPASARPHPAAPPVYRPQSAPKVLQAKKVNEPHTQATRRSSTPTPPPAPPAHRPPPPQGVHQKRADSIQPKPFNSRTVQRAVERGGMFGAALFNLFDAEPVPAAAAAPAPPVDDKERIRQERALRDQARRAAAALRLQREEEAKLERIAFYRLAAPAAHDYIRTHSVQQITETKFSLKLFATYPSRHRYTRAITGYGGEYMFNPIGRDVLIANSVIHVHWDTKGGREYGHFKNHINKNVGGAVSGIASLGAIEEAKLDALGIPSVVSMLIIVDPKYYKEF